MKFYFFFSLFLFFSCARIPKDSLAKSTESFGCDTSIHEMLETDLFKEGPVDFKEWWEKFDEPLLNEFIINSLAHHPTLKKAEAQLKASIQSAFQRRSKLYPEIDFYAEDNWQHLGKTSFFRAFAPNIPAVINEMELGLNFTYEFDFWGKNRKIFEAALGKVFVKKAEELQSKLILSTSIAYSYFQVRSFIEQIRILKEIEVNKKEIEEIQKLRYEEGIESFFPKLSSTANVLDVQTIFVETERDLKLEIDQLKALCGLTQDTPINIDSFGLKIPQFSLPSHLSLDIISKRPDIMAQKGRIEVAAKEIGVAKTAFYPDINLTSFIGLDSIYLSSLFQAKSFSASLTPAFNLPIFTAKRLTSQLREKVENYNEAVFTYDELILQVAQEIADKLTQIVCVEKEIALRKLSLETAVNKEKIVLERYENGLENKMALLDAKNIVLEVEMDIVQLEFNKLEMYVQLIRGLGGGVTDL